jgi:hypothetical protein
MSTAVATLFGTPNVRAASPLGAYTGSPAK